MTSVALTRRRSWDDDFATLSREVRHAGLLERTRMRRYRTNAGKTKAAMYTQLAFIGHDAGHKQIFRDRHGNDAVGYLHGGLIGLSYDWWVGKHTRHHADPNHEDDDPDLDIPALAFTRDQARNKHQLDYLRKQVLTSRNVHGGRWLDLVLGGLNHQIEHHLFPTMPRPNLRRAQTLVQDFARYYAQVLQHLRDAGAPLRHHKEARTT